MAIGAADPMDVVSTPGAGEGRVHFLDVDAAVGHLGMAVFAGGSGVLIVSGVAGETADAFVYAHGRAVVARSNLRTPVVCRGDCGGLRLARCVALIAERLALAGADLHRARTV